ncbi:MAG: hypothetical protein HQM12_19985 [SAR324 cluster bacterium]|nr:hypothetical protein [SAR324 cluster bacterium]
MPVSWSIALFRFNTVVREYLAAWLSLMLFLTAQRLIFFLVSFPYDLFEKVTPVEIFGSLIMGMRMDSMVVTILTMPLLLALIPFIPLPLFPRLSWQKLIHRYTVFGSIVLLILFLLEYSSWQISQQRFGKTFLESWSDPVYQHYLFDLLTGRITFWVILFSVVAGCLLSIFLQKIISGKLPVLEHIVFFQRPRGVILWLLLWLLALRGTTGIPLPIQYELEMLSPNPYLANMQTNSGFNLYMSWKETFEKTQKQIEKVKQDALPRKLQSIQLYAGTNPRRVIETKGQSIGVRYNTLPLRTALLKALPKHVFMITLPNTLEWMWSAEKFNGFPQLSQVRGSSNVLSFSSFFPNDRDSLYNILTMIHGIPLPEYYPLSRLTEYPDWKNYQTLPFLMKQRGYHTRFVYGGALHHQILEAFARNTGFDEVITMSHQDRSASNGVEPGLPLMDSLSATIKDNDMPSFNLIIPDINFSRQRLKSSVNVNRTSDFPYPESWYQAMDQQLSQWYHQMNALRQDTLFVFISDGGIPLQWTPENREIYASMKIPFWIQTSLLRYGSRTFEFSGTNLDILPTLVSLLFDQETTISSWGYSLLERPDRINIFTRMFSCVNQMCVVQKQPFSLSGKDTLTSCQTPVCQDQAKVLQHQTRSLFNSGLFLLHAP